MANECACVLCTLSRLTGECLLGHACMHGVGPVGMWRMGRALVARVHILRHGVLKRMKGQAPHTVRRLYLLFGGAWPIYMDQRA